MLLREARLSFDAAGIATPDLDARTLLLELSGLSLTDLIGDPGRRLACDTADTFRAACARRLAGEPVYRILGVRSFYGLEIGLSRDTLEPRPDTEILVDTVLPFVRDVVARKGDCTAVDMGTGSGAIALALMVACADLRCVGVDIASGALATASANAERHRVAGRFRALESDWFAGLTGRFDILVSNPPYIATPDIAGLSVEVRNHDPVRALDGGTDGLDAYRILAANAARHLNKHGIVAVEIGSAQKAEVCRLFSAAGFELETAARDLAGHDRVLVWRAPMLQANDNQSGVSHG
jgi:release factor glutamine methyltransferase